MHLNFVLLWSDCRDILENVFSDHIFVDLDLDL